MTDYTELVNALTCGNDGKLPCHNNECPYWVDQWHGIGLCNVIKKDADAAAAMEKLLSFAHYVADKVTMSDEDWEEYHNAFTEVACRKLVKLGVISIEDDMYVYRRDEPQEVQDDKA